jgi:tetratricopeptide (TPR) repeat protein
LDKVLDKNHSIHQLTIDFYICNINCLRIALLMIRQQLLHFSCLCCLFITLTIIACQDTTYDEPSAFFSNPKYAGGDYFKTIPIFNPDSVVARIQADVPPKWWGLACEGAFFNLPDSVPNAQLFIHLATYERAFPHDSVRAFAQLLRGRTFINEAKYDSALMCLNDCYNISMRDKRIVRAGDAKFYLGRMAMRRGNYPEAVRLFLETYDILKPMPIDGGRIFEVMLDLGKAYRSRKDYESAQIWHQKAYTYSFTCCLDELLGYKIQGASAMAENYLYLNKVDSARIYIDTAFKVQNRAKLYYQEADRYRILAKIQIAQGQYQAALAHLQVAKQRNEQKENALVISRFDKDIATAYNGLGRLDSALFFYKNALLTPDSTVQVDILRQMSNIYAQQRRYQEALHVEQQSRALETRLFSIEKEQTLAALTIKKDAEAQINKAETETRLTQMGLLFCCILLAFVIAGSWIWIKKNKQEKVLAETREQLKAYALAETEAVLAQTEKKLAFKESLINNLQLQLLETQSATNAPQNALKDTTTLRQIKVLTTDDWMRFRTLFDQEYPNLTIRVKEHFPDLSPSEMRLFLLIKTGFDPQEIAYMTGIALSSVYKSRHRLRRKLGLIDDDGFDAFIQAF